MCECVCQTKPQDKALVKTLSVHFHRTVSRSSGPDGCKWYHSAHDRCLLCVRWWRNQRSCSTPWASQLKHNKSQKVLRQFGLKFYCSIFAKCWAVWGFILTTFFLSLSHEQFSNLIFAKQNSHLELKEHSKENQCHFLDETEKQIVTWSDRSFKFVCWRMNEWRKTLEYYMS